MASIDNSQTGLTPAGKLFGVGADMLGQIEKTIRNQKITGLRIKLGNRVLKEVSIEKASTIITVVLALVAVVVSSLSVEVEHEPQPTTS